MINCGSSSASPKISLQFSIYPIFFLYSQHFAIRSIKDCSFTSSFLFLVSSRTIIWDFGFIYPLPANFPSKKNTSTISPAFIPSSVFSTSLAKIHGCPLAIRLEIFLFKLTLFIGRKVNNKKQGSGNKNQDSESSGSNHS